MKPEQRKMVGIYLDASQDEKLDKIAEAMSKELGVPVSRSGAVARLIGAFSLPVRPQERIAAVETEAAA